MIQEGTDHDSFRGEPFSVYNALDEGALWAQNKLVRIEELLLPVEAAQMGPPPDDDIPF